VSFAFTSFRARLLAFVLGLLVLVQGAVLLSVGRANVGEARRHVDEALEHTARAFARALAVRNRSLVEKARLLSSDFAFKHMMLVAMDGSLTVDTLHAGAHAEPCALAGPVQAAAESEFGEADAFVFVDGVPYQLAVVPLFTPEPTAWILIGFEIDDAFAEELRQETGTHVSLLRPGEAAEPFASTLSEALRRDVARGVGAATPGTDGGASLVMPLAGEDYVTWLVSVRGSGAGPDASSGIVAVLQRSLAEALAPYLRLRGFLLAIFGAGLALSVAGGSWLAARVTRPVAALARGARRVVRGDYEEPVDVPQRDELGLLASSFNDMMKGLSERDRVRDLLGKVVSPEVAEQLLSRGIELGGEERRVSVLFSDVRDFTSLSERKAPAELVDLLNAHLTRVSAIVERHGGVVDKYIGDAVMAVFGAPLARDDDAVRAVRAALELAALPAGDARGLVIGVGVNTDVVVAGNMGSRTRLNYTVIGDGVNLASRLEGLTKRYGVSAIVSESTRDACPDFAFRELDRVRVKGKSRPVRIFEPLGEAAALSGALSERLARHDQALASYRAGRLDEALRGFQALAAEGDAALYAVYRERIPRLQASGLPPDWDGTTVFEEK
jgi:adenylate cyclase